MADSATRWLRSLGLRHASCTPKPWHARLRDRASPARSTVTRQIAMALRTVYGGVEDDVDIARVIRTLVHLSIARGVPAIVVERRLDAWRCGLPGVLWPSDTLDDALNDLHVQLNRPARWTAARISAAITEHWNIALGIGGVLVATTAGVLSSGYQR